MSIQAEVRADEQLARQLGINGVPFFLIESKWAVSGAQPAEMLVQALRQVWEETHRVEFLNPLATENAQASESGASCDMNGNCS